MDTSKCNLTVTAYAEIEANYPQRARTNHQYSLHNNKECQLFTLIKQHSIITRNQMKARHVIHCVSYCTYKILQLLQHCYSEIKHTFMPRERRNKSK